MSLPDWTEISILAAAFLSVAEALADNGVIRLTTWSDHDGGYGCTVCGYPPRAVAARCNRPLPAVRYEHLPPPTQGTGPVSHMATRS